MDFEDMHGWCEVEHKTVAKLAHFKNRLRQIASTPFSENDVDDVELDVERAK
jgi:hypothetical protein